MVALVDVYAQKCSNGVSLGIAFTPTAWQVISPATSLLRFRDGEKFCLATVKLRCTLGNYLVAAGLVVY